MFEKGKVEEILVDARSDTDVQIVPKTQVLVRKMNDKSNYLVAGSLRSFPHGSCSCTA